MADKFNFRKVIAKLEAAKSRLPMLLANDTKNYFVKSFNSESWDGKKWKEVERRRKGTKAYKYSTSASRTRHILVKSGKLRRALMNSIRLTTFRVIKFEVPLVYAQVHNEGLRAGKGAGFNMPKRQFMGDTKGLREIQKKRLRAEINKAFGK